MATHYSSGQYEDAYVARKLQNWNLPRVFKEHPSAHEGYTQFIANDRGHLLPSVPRSKASPWGTYLGTWDMPLKIPPAKVNLTSRSVDAAAHLIEWIGKSTALDTACNGFRPQVIGKPNDPPARIKEETSAKCSQASRRGLEPPSSAGKMPAQKEAESRGAATPKGPLSRQPGCMDIRLKEEAPPDTQASQQLEPKEQRERSGSEIPISRQPGSMDVRLKDTVAPKIPVQSRPSSRESALRRAASAEASPAGWPKSLEGKSKGVSTPELLASYRTGSMEANPRRARSPEAPPSSRPATKASQALETQKGLVEPEMDRRERGGLARPLSCPEEQLS
ncbi:Protein Flattop [Varanus komodoensis]|nr:Protein Flattop [Varanus komodoensis]